jgi:oligoendopeptidase F
VYAYAFGELLTMSLYQQAKREGEPFVEKYERLLRLGGAQSPQELISIVGVDLTSREFWQGGLDAIKSLVDDFEATKARLGQ